MGGLFSAYAWNKIWNFRHGFLLGLGNTVVTALFGILLALLLGMLFGLMATSGRKGLRLISRVYVEFIRTRRSCCSSVSCTTHWPFRNTPSA